ncbi:hypothetical protein HOLleu_12569 [Holothuria leucospilota]|uniref:Uncharacterized protein n=1 Tax=Holothuria leucospilota TaxID=206669 RepID=A0A9Q1CB27_HOLLE|nr:hypothetical protein HOLleu_12569 [Holothuria leucospilota]
MKSVGQSYLEISRLQVASQTHIHTHIHTYTHTTSPLHRFLACLRQGIKNMPLPCMGHLYRRKMASQMI